MHTFRQEQQLQHFQTVDLHPISQEFEPNRTFQEIIMVMRLSISVKINKAFKCGINGEAVQLANVPFDGMGQAFRTTEILFMSLIDLFFRTDFITAATIPLGLIFLQE